MSDATSSALSRPNAAPILIVPLARFVLGVFFRRIEVVGAERIPQGRPLMVVANHVNGLVDAAVLLAALPLRPRFLAKSTLWSNPIVRPFLDLAAAIPVFRRQDPGVDTSANVDMFAACHEVLRAGGAIALFPEGTSHNEPALVPLKTGVSRIVLEAEDKYRTPSGRIESRIVPVGLTFDDKGRFRSRVLVHVGEPRDPGPELELYASEPREAVRRLTDRVRNALEDVTLNFPSWDEARLIERAAEIFGRPQAELPTEESLGERFELRRGFIEGYERLRADRGPEVERVARAVREYDEMLEDYGLDDAQVASSYPPGEVLAFVVKSFGLMLVRAPLAAVGMLVNAVPYQTVALVARRFAKSPDTWASYKVFGSLFIYPATWLLLALGAGWAWGLWPALVALAAGPGSGYFALRFVERRRYFQRHARAYLILKSGRPGIEELRRLRSEVLRSVESLAADFLASASVGQAPPASSPRGVE